MLSDEWMMSTISLNGHKLKVFMSFSCFLRKFLPFMKAAATASSIWALIPWGRDAILFPCRTSDHRNKQERGRQRFYRIHQVKTWMEREVEMLHSLRGKTTRKVSLPLPKLEKPSSFRGVQQVDIAVYLELCSMHMPTMCLFFFFFN